MVGNRSFIQTWSDFENHCPASFRQLWDDTDFTDVTLALEDGSLLKAHKVILSSSSQLFRQLLKQNPHPSPLICLMGVQSRQLKAILSYIYRGHCEVLEEDKDNFLATGKFLMVEGLMEEMKNDNDNLEDATILANIEGLQEFFEENLETKIDCTDIINYEDLKNEPLSRTIDADSAGLQNLKKGKNAARDKERAQKKAVRVRVRAAMKAEKEEVRLVKKQRAAYNKAEKARRSELYREGKVIDSEVNLSKYLRPSTCRGEVFM